MAKELYTFRLADDVASLLKKMAEKDDRSQAYIIEQLVREAGIKAKIKPDKKA